MRPEQSQANFLEVRARPDRVETGATSGDLTEVGVLNLYRQRPAGIAAASVGFPDVGKDWLSRQHDLIPLPEIAVKDRLCADRLSCLTDLHWPIVLAASRAVVIAACLPEVLNQKLS